MTTIEKAHIAAKKNTVYSYNPKTLEALCEAGYSAIPEGSTLMSAGGQVLKLQNNAVVCWQNGQAGKTTPVNDANREQVVIMYAVNASATGIHMGAF
jgi:hypothetical protein